MGNSELQYTPTATDNGVRDGNRFDWSHPLSYTWQYPLSYTYCTVQWGLQYTRLAVTSEDRTRDLRNASPTHSLCSHSWYKNWIAIKILNSKIDKVAEWFDSNKLTLNINKNQMVMLSRNADPPRWRHLVKWSNTNSKQGKILRLNCWPTPKLERPHINGITQNF